MLRYAPDYKPPPTTGYRPMDPIVPGVTYGGSPGAWGNGFYGGGGYHGGGYMGNYMTPRRPMQDLPPPQEPFGQSPFQDTGIGEFLRRLRGYGQQFQPVNLFQPMASGVNLQGAFGGGN